MEFSVVKKKVSLGMKTVLAEVSFVALIPFIEVADTWSLKERNGFSSSFPPVSHPVDRQQRASERSRQAASRPARI